MYLGLLMTSLNPRNQGYSQCGDARVILGRVENVVLQDSKLKLKARIDTGAGVSSIHADILEIKKAGPSGTPRDRIIFRLRDKGGRVVRLERDVQEWMRVKRKGTAGFIDRPVVLMDFCLGGKVVEARVNLANRSRFLYPLLIGRNVLKAGDFLIDPSRAFLEHPGCKWKAKEPAL
jgi:hypothetical protein